MLYPYFDVLLEVDIPEKTDYLVRLAQLVDDLEDEEFRFKRYLVDGSDTDGEEYFGKGNAKKGYKQKYKKYNPSKVYTRLKDRQRVWDAFIPFTPAQFIELCDECMNLWILPRQGDIPKSRKHQIEACLFSTIGSLKTGMSDLEMEGVVQMSHGLINIEFERMLTILDKVLETEMNLLTDSEKEICTGAAKSHPGILYYLDGCDFPVRIGENKYLYKTHKKNVKHQRAIRTQILVDS